MHVKGKPKKPKKLSAFDEWFLAKLNDLVITSEKSFNSYECSRVKSEFENFFWHVFSDDYLEVVKDRLYSEDRSAEEKQAAQYVLYNSLYNQLKILAPIMPHITEELYQKYFKKDGAKSIHISEWPSVKKVKAPKGGEKAIEI